jgi:hypothetical protein
MSHVAVDFESFYDKEISITKLGVWNYLRHPRCDIYLVTIYDEKRGWKYVGRPEDFDWRCLENELLVSHNAAFDSAVFKRLVELKKADDVKFAAWNCTANLSVYHRGGRSLKDAVRNLLNGEVSKDVRKAMIGLTDADMKKMPPIYDKRFANFYEEVCDYALIDAIWCWRLWERFAPTWPIFEQRLSLQTINSGFRGLPVDEKALDGGIKILEKAIWKAQQDLPWVNDSSDAKALSPKALAQACREAGIPAPASMAEDDPACQEWESIYGKKFKWVESMRVVRKANLLLARLKIMRERTIDGRFKFGMKYGGAHTMRWSGDAGFNVQGFPKEPFCGVDIRKCVRAPKGRKFIIADKSQIEARITLYLAGDDQTLDLIRQGVSVYEAHARLTMGWKGGALKKENPALYQLAKCRVLGLGFGCGPVRFRDLARNEYGIEMDLTEAKRVVANFRAANPKIVRLWNMLDAAFRQSVGGNYEIELPSGRVMTYFDVTPARSSANKAAFQARVERNGPFKTLYGGLLCENLVQATARDVFAMDLINLEDAGFDVLFHVHDEVILECDENRDVDEVKTIMSMAPSWLDGCPIGVEAVESDVYLK